MFAIAVLKEVFCLPSQTLHVAFLLLQPGGTWILSCDCNKLVALQLPKIMYERAVYNHTQTKQRQIQYNTDRIRCIFCSSESSGALLVHLSTRSNTICKAIVPQLKLRATMKLSNYHRYRKYIAHLIQRTCYCKRADTNYYILEKTINFHWSTKAYVVTTRYYTLHSNIWRPQQYL